jgi:hypothetical protein
VQKVWIAELLASRITAELLKRLSIVERKRFHAALPTTHFPIRRADAQLPALPDRGLNIFRFNLEGTRS